MVEALIRVAVEADLPRVLALYAAAGIDDELSFTVAEAGEQLAVMASYPSYRLFVAEVDGVVAGTYELLIMDNMAKRGRQLGIVEDVAVDPAFQGRGIGRAMMTHAREECRKAACYKLMLSSNLKREAAHRFYESLGFERHGYSFLISG